MRNLEAILKQPQHKITLSHKRFEQIKTILVIFIIVFFVSSFFYTPIGFVTATVILLLTIIENFSTPLKLLGVGVEPKEYDVDSLYYQLNTTYHQTAKELVKEAIERSPQKVLDYYTTKEVLIALRKMDEEEEKKDLCRIAGISLREYALWNFFGQECDYCLLKISRKGSCVGQEFLNNNPDVNTQELIHMICAKRQKRLLDLNLTRSHKPIERSVRKL